MLAGLLGVPFGSYLAQRLRPFYSDCDPLICAFGLIISSPCIYIALIVAQHSANWCFFFVFAAEITLNLSWSIIADMLLVRFIFRLDGKRKKARRKFKWIYAELFSFSGLFQTIFLPLFF